MAAELNFFFAAEMEAAFDEGEMRKTRKPNERMPASTSVIGLVRRNALGNAMAVQIKMDFPGQNDLVVLFVPQKRRG